MVGYSVQKHHVEQLPSINPPTEKSRSKRYLVSDSIEGWSDAIKMLCKCYFEGRFRVRFDLSDIRPKGSRLITSGGKAPGPEPLRICLTQIESVFASKKPGEKLTPIECHDIQCYIADAVLAGGIRRAAMISLFSKDDMDMITCKSGNWWELNSQRGRANNSVVLKRGDVSKDEFNALWSRIKNSGSGEPGIYWTNDLDWGTNPCCEIALRPFQFCNLVELNASNIESQKDFNDRCAAASVIATLQASYTDFHYLRSQWKRTTEKDALLGVSMTGIASMEVFKYDIEEGVNIVKKVNADYAELLGINPAARTTCVKPAGTTSLVLGTSSGIHAWHNDYYMRRIRVGKNEAIYKYLKTNLPEFIEDDLEKPHIQAIIAIPQKAPVGSITRHESAIDLLERVKTISARWVQHGHDDGKNTHNVSATISIKDDEWDIVKEWMWVNKNSYNGLSVLPYFGGTYKQAPFEDITKEQYEALESKLSAINLENVIEEVDNTDLQGELACAGGHCEII